jgi:hypothetical protein
LGNEEERKQAKKLWYKMRREAWKKLFDEINSKSHEIFGLSRTEEQATEERNDVYIYKTLRYPPKSTPPTFD